MVELEVGERLYDLLENSVIPIVFTVLYGKFNHNRHITKLEARLAEFEKKGSASP